MGLALDRTEAVRRDWAEGLRLKAWVARSDDIDAVLAEHGRLLGTKTWLEKAFYFSLLPDGALPMSGALPCVIDRCGRPSPSTRMEDQGLRLRALVLEHPEPDKVAPLYRQIGISDPPNVLQGPRIRLRALIDTPSGVKTLT